MQKTRVIIHSGKHPDKNRAGEFPNSLELYSALEDKLEERIRESEYTMFEDVCAEASFQESVGQLPVVEQNFSKKLTVGRRTDRMERKERLSLNLKDLLRERNISMYRLSQISGVPKTTIIDICSGKSSIGNCSAKNVYAIATAMDCTVEFLLNMSADT